MKKRIDEVFIFKNAERIATMVVDEQGNQMPKYQGDWKDVYKKVLSHCDSETLIHDMRIEETK